MNLDEIERGMIVMVPILLAGSVAVYIGVGLPRLRTRVSIVLTGVLALSACLGAFLAKGVLSVALLACAAALLGAQGGWVAGRRSLRMAARLAKERRALKTEVAAKAKEAVSAIHAPSAGGASPPVRVSPRGSLTKIGPFKIDREIGRGSMGAVYLGVDPAGRQVAIKSLALGSEFDNEAQLEAKARFVREAETAGRLKHADIVTILDAGEDKDLAYIAMEYVRGHDLHGYAQPGRLLSVTTVLNVVARVADALAYAHRHGVVHRDVKPSNVMVDFSIEQVKIMDFGIAHVVDAQRTRTGLVLGTPSYMSPEQLAGGAIDGRSDIYSLGVTLFQLLTGQLPHQADSMSRVLHLIANEPAPDVRSLRPELPEALANVVALALEKRPETRYGDAAQFAADLREVASWFLSSQAAGIFGDSSAAMVRTAALFHPLIVATDPQPPQDFTSTVVLMRPETRHNRGS